LPTYLSCAISPSPVFCSSLYFWSSNVVLSLYISPILFTLLVVSID
jgi:hypothetical protein